MAENSWLKVEREYFIESNKDKFKVLKSTLNKILENYNRFLQKSLLGESPFVAEDLKITMEKAEGKNAESKDS